MGEVTEEVKIVKVRMMCDKCGGEMVQGNVMRTSNQPQYQHKCDKCGNVEYYIVQYPTIRYETLSVCD